MAIITYLIIDLRDTHDIPVTRAAWALAAAQVAGMAGRVVLAAWSDRLRSGRVTAITVALAGAAVGATIMAVFPAAAPFWSILLLAVGFGFFSFGWYGPWVVHIAEVAPGHAVGLALALAMTANQLAIVTAPPLFGLLVDITGGFTLPWLAVAVALLLAAVRVRVGAARLRRPAG
jgi:MFS family permease